MTSANCSDARFKTTVQPQYVEILAKGLKLWNHWRTQHPDLVPNFFRADLRGQYLSGFDLRRANLSRADLSEADLSRVNLSGAVLKETLFARTNLFRADLTSTDLRRAVFVDAHLREAKLKGAMPGRTVLARTDLSHTTGLDEVVHEDASEIGINTLLDSGYGQPPLAFLRGTGVADNLIEYLPALTSRTIQFYSCYISYWSKSGTPVTREGRRVQASPDELNRWLVGENPVASLSTSLILVVLKRLSTHRFFLAAVLRSPISK